MKSQLIKRIISIFLILIISADTLLQAAQLAHFITGIKKISKVSSSKNECIFDNNYMPNVSKDFNKNHCDEKAKFLSKKTNLKRNKKSIKVKSKFDGGGPSMPEVQGFTSASSDNLVNLSTGDFNYSIPLLDVGGFPINIQYGSGIGTQDEASWVGLGWNLNPGSVTRQVRGLPDDLSGESVIKETCIKPKMGFDIGAGLDLNFAGINIPVDLDLGIKMDYNNYEGWGVDLDAGIGVSMEGEIGSSKIGADLGIGGGVSSRGGGYMTPKLSLSGKHENEHQRSSFGLGVSMSIDSREGLKDISFRTNYNHSKFINGQKFGQSFSHSFASPTFTPPFEVPTHTTSGNYSLNLSGTVYHVGIGGNITGGYIDQSVQNRVVKNAYGYMNSHLANNESLLDFNRENDGVYINEIPNLPITAFTYDLFSVNDADAGGTFRPFRMDIGSLHDPILRNTSDNHNIGLDIEFGNLVQVGVDGGVGVSKNEIRKWESGNALSSVFDFKHQEDGSLFEPVYFKSMDEISIMEDSSVYNALGKHEPVRAELSQDLLTSTANATTKIGSDSKGFWNINSDVIKRNRRDYRKKLFSWISKAEYRNSLIDRSRNPKSRLDETLVGSATPTQFTLGDQIEEIQVTNESGVKTVFGLPVYNNSIKEVSFNIQSRTTTEQSPRESSNGLVNYENSDATISNQKGENNYFNATTTPTHAYAWLLTEKLSPDYVDVSNDGPTADDLGTYTSFQYKKVHHDFRWRTPLDSASFQSQSLHTENDNMASYVYGSKEIYYLEKIKSKNFIAIFHTSPRHDGLGVRSERGGVDNQKQLHKLDSIQLFTEESYAISSRENIPIKTVYFEYDYSLCKNQPNTNALSVDRGKLTLKKLYFSYGESSKHKHSPYVFYYNKLNPSYEPKAVDRWGNYKPVDPTREDDFPYSDQTLNQNDYAQAWHLDSITNPMGGSMKIEYESDDYAYVQDRRAMNMMPIIGISSTQETSEFRADENIMNVYNGDQINNYLYFKIPENCPRSINGIRRMIEGIDNLYFSCLVRVDPNTEHPKFTRVEGFIPINFANDDIGLGTGSHIDKFWIRIPKVKIGSDPEINNVPEFSYTRTSVTRGRGRHPFTHAAFQLIQSSFPNLIKPELEESIDREQTLTVEGIGAAFSRLQSAFDGIGAGGVFNYLYNQRRCEQIKLYDSYVRLYNSQGIKYGGGSRVKRILMHDNWGLMQQIPDLDQNYYYGVEYDYFDGNQSSGVAAYEPTIGKDENPFTMPVNYTVHRKLVQDINNYQLEPIGAIFFPSPHIVYSKVVQKNIPRPDVKRHATGYTIAEFYTAKDFPTIVSKTSKYAIPKTLIVPLQFYSRAENTVTTTQGFSVELNDMHGKMKSTKEYDEYGNLIQSQELFYQVDDNGKLDNYCNTVDPLTGIIGRRLMGVNYDCIVDATNHYTEANTGGLQYNLNFAQYGPVPVGLPIPIPVISQALTEYRGLTITKVIQKNGILKEKRTTNMGQVVNNWNEAYDPYTGNVIVSSADNDYDSLLYSVALPAYWAYKEMGFQSNNYRTKILRLPISNSTFSLPDANDKFVSGDELVIYDYRTYRSQHAWVYKIEGDRVLLIQRNGQVFSDLEGVYMCTLIQSAYSNMLDQVAGSIVTALNPIQEGRLNLNSPSVLDAKANLFSDFWQTNFAYSSTIQESSCQCMPNFSYVNDKSRSISFTPRDGKVFASIIIPQESNNISVRSNRISIEIGNGCFVEIYSQDGLGIGSNKLDILFSFGKKSSNVNCNPENILEGEYQGRIFYLISDCISLFSCTVVPGERRTTCGLEANIQNPFLTGVLGNYRPLASYVPHVKRVSNNRIYESGFYDRFIPFWTFNGRGLVKNSDQGDWVRSDSVVAMNSKGQVLEAWNALNIPSSTYYQFGDLLQVAVGSNAYYNDIVYEGFEGFAYNYRRTRPSGMHCEFRPHLEFATEMPADILTSSFLTREKRHSGSTSLRVIPGTDFRTRVPVLKRNLQRSTKAERLSGRQFTVESEDILVPFSPRTGVKYIVSAWIHQDASDASNFSGFDLIINNERFSANGPIIDGWQQINGEFELSSGISYFNIALQTTVPTWIDDLRIQPLESVMETYSYDNKKLIMLAKHDDLNFSSFFEYDATGNLERTKKETEYGIITMKENRSELPKK